MRAPLPLLAPRAPVQPACACTRMHGGAAPRPAVSFACERCCSPPLLRLSHHCLTRHSRSRSHPTPSLLPPPRVFPPRYGPWSGSEAFSAADVLKVGEHVDVRWSDSGTKRKWVRGFVIASREVISKKATTARTLSQQVRLITAASFASRPRLHPRWLAAPLAVPLAALHLPVARVPPRRACTRDNARPPTPSV